MLKQGDSLWKEWYTLICLRIVTLKRLSFGTVARGGEHRCKKIVDALAEQFTLTTEQRNRRYPNGDNVFYHLCNAPCRSLVKRGLLESPATGYYKITR